MTAGICACERAPAPGPSGDTAKSAPPGGATKKLTVCLLPKKKGVPYFSTCAQGAQEAARELGDVELIYDGPTDGAPEKSASMIEKWTLQGVSVIAVSPMPAGVSTTTVS